VEAGEKSGERTWSFPLGEEYRAGLESKVADLLQCSTGSNADHIYAATFLSHFIGEETPWVHVDLSAQENEGGLGLVRSDVTGFGILWAERFLAMAKGEA
jgi:leucyl aminopeptidase